MADLAGEIEDALEAPKAEVILELPSRAVSLSAVSAPVVAPGRIGNGKIYLRAELAQDPRVQGLCFEIVPEDYPRDLQPCQWYLGEGKLVMNDGSLWVEFDAPEGL